MIEPKECKEEHTETPTSKRDSIFKGLFEGSIFKVGPTWEEDGKKVNLTNHVRLLILQYIIP